MSERASQIILLCEDELHERLVKAYMKECSLETQEPCMRSLVASRMVQGGNVDWVLREFAGQVHACRQRLKQAKTLLVVMADADRLTLGTIPSTLRGYFADMRHVSQSGPGIGTNTLTGNLEVIERDRLTKALARASWVQAKAARALGITPRQIAYKIRKYQLSPDATSLS